MVETRVVLCDVCKERVSKYKCMICGADICSSPDCKRDITITIEGDTKAILKIHYCDKHGSILRRRIADEFFSSDVRSKLVEDVNSYFLKKLTSEGLKQQNSKENGKKV